MRDSDGTVIFSIKPELRGGSLFTQQVTERLGKPCLHLSRENGIEEATRCLHGFIEENRIAVLNVAGPRASQEPEVGQYVQDVLNRLFGSCPE